MELKKLTMRNTLLGLAIGDLNNRICKQETKDKVGSNGRYWYEWIKL
jgi:hypothetical protein